ncbi:MAG: polymer-forming cytoskeletal protein [bacterium]|nr:polymer-forming cytoskeletal protein [bacterium]
MALFDRSDRRRPSEESTQKPAQQAPPQTAPEEPAKPEPTQPKYPSSGAPLAAESARIGPGLAIEGDIHGDEDLILDGKIRGSLSLGRHQLLIGEAGSAQADLSARKIVVFGDVVGNIKASETVELRRTATVKGNIRAASLCIEEGATLNGRVEMGGQEKPKSKAKGAKPPKPNGEPASAPA